VPFSGYLTRSSLYGNGAPFLNGFARKLRHARVEILVLYQAEPDSVEPSSDSSSERCIQQPPDASSPSNWRPLWACRKPNTCGLSEIHVMVIEGSEGKYVYPKSLRIMANGGISVWVNAYMGAGKARIQSSSGDDAGLTGGGLNSLHSPATSGAPCHATAHAEKATASAIRRIVGTKEFYLEFSRSHASAHPCSAGNFGRPTLFPTEVVASWAALDRPLFTHHCPVELF